MQIRTHCAQAKTFKLHATSSGSAGSAKRIQSAAHLPVCIGFLDHRSQLLCPDHWESNPFKDPSPPLARRTGCCRPNAGSMQVHQTFSAEMAPRALKMPSRWSKSPPRALEVRSRCVKSPSGGPGCILEPFYIDFGAPTSAPGMFKIRETK